eukprot:353453-Chlamydomonas_euryale.AAC.6
MAGRRAGDHIRDASSELIPRRRMILAQGHVNLVSRFLNVWLVDGVTGPPGLSRKPEGLAPPHTELQRAHARQPDQNRIAKAD